jgi:DNA-binding NarL/FixJ family response regulator
MSDERTAVLLVDDDVDLLHSMALLVEASFRLRLAGCAANTQDALDLCAQRHPDVVLADIRMPGRDGINLTRVLTGGDRQARPRVLVTTAFALDEYLLAALGGGASGFLPKGASWEDTEHALVRVDHGDIVLPEVMYSRLVDLILPGHAQLGSLSKREVEVLSMVGAGRTVPEIAAALVLSEGTVRIHLEHLRTKLGARSRTDLAIVAYQAGLGHGPG